MTSLKKFEKNPQKQLMEELSDARCVMLGSTNPDHHMQPMAPQIDTVDGGTEIFFYSDKFSELGEQIIENPGEVNLCYMEKDYQACVKGHLSISYDEKIVEKFWNPIVAAWYPGGKSDPKMMLLRFVPESASIWASDLSVIGFMYEVARANLTNEMPDMGKTKEIPL